MREFFFHNLTLGYITKILNQIFFPPPKSEYFFQQHWESEYFFRKNHTPPFKLNGLIHVYKVGPSWSWSCGSWIYNYLCNQCLSPLKLRVLILLMARCSSSTTSRWFSPVSSNVELIESVNISDEFNYLKWIYLPWSDILVSA
jgi:hypothetical protein